MALYIVWESFYYSGFWSTCSGDKIKAEYIINVQKNNISKGGIFFHSPVRKCTHCNLTGDIINIEGYMMQMSSNINIHQSVCDICYFKVIAARYPTILQVFWQMRNELIDDILLLIFSQVTHII